MAEVAKVIGGLKLSTGQHLIFTPRETPSHTTAVSHLTGLEMNAHLFNKIVDRLQCLQAASLQEVSENLVLWGHP